MTLYRRQETRKRKAKWLSEEALQIAVNRKEVKAEEKRKEIPIRIQSIARRDKKAFLSDQCKEVEENNRMGKTRDLFKKMRGTKGRFYEKMGTIKDRNGMDLTEKMLRGGGKNTQKNYIKNIFMTQITTMV